MHRFRSLLVFALCLCLPLSGCGSDEDQTPDLGEWTLATDGRTLTDTLRVSETETYFFGSIQDFDVTTDGRMVVLDGEATHLKVLRPDGTLLDTLGRRGQAPGEFQHPSTAEVARGDSIYVFDPGTKRLTVFALSPTPSMARSVAIDREQGSRGTDAWGVLRGGRILDGTLAARFWPYYAREEGYRQPAHVVWRSMSEAGVLGDTLLHERRTHIAISFEGQGVGIEPLPFDRETVVAPGPDGRLYHGVTDSLQVHATTHDGTTTTVAHVPTEPVPVTAADRDSALARIERADIRKQFVDAMPPTKPAFTDLVVAGDGHLWVRRPTDGPDAETVAWWVLTLETKTIHEVQLPTDVSLEVVQNGKAYGTTTTDVGAPAVVRYRIES
jgi:hypothetical protein